MRITVNFSASATKLINGKPLVQLALRRGIVPPVLGMRPCDSVSRFSTALRLYPKGPHGAVTCIPRSLCQRYHLHDIAPRGSYVLYPAGENWFVLRPANGHLNGSPLVYLSENNG